MMRISWKEVVFDGPRGRWVTVANNPDATMWLLSAYNCGASNLPRGWSLEPGVEIDWAGCLSDELREARRRPFPKVQAPA